MSAVTTVAEAVAAATRALAAHSESPRLDAELLLGKVLGCSRAAVIARTGDSLPDDSARAYDGLVARRADGTPVAYLTGLREFWSLPLQVTPDVLVPRPETEILVELALTLAPAAQPCTLLDLGTGSGAIALAIATERPAWRITGVDVSQQALAVAAGNATRLAVPNVEWHWGSWFVATPGRRFDIVVANPPYIAGGDPALTTLRAEPGIALSPGPSGLEAFELIATAAPDHLLDRGWLAFEHGIEQAADVSRLLAQRGFTAVRTINDFSGRPRVTLGTFHSQH